MCAKAKGSVCEGKEECMQRQRGVCVKAKGSVCEGKEECVRR